MSSGRLDSRFYVRWKTGIVLILPKEDWAGVDMSDGRLGWC